MLLINSLALPASRPFFFFFFNDTATTEIYTLSLHDALPICCPVTTALSPPWGAARWRPQPSVSVCLTARSEEHTSELQSRLHLVCRLLLEKKKATTSPPNATTPVPAAITAKRTLRAGAH